MHLPLKTVGGISFVDTAHVAYCHFLESKTMRMHMAKYLLDNINLIDGQEEIMLEKYNTGNRFIFNLERHTEGEIEAKRGQNPTASQTATHVKEFLRVMLAGLLITKAEFNFRMSDAQANGIKKNGQARGSGSRYDETHEVKYDFGGLFNGSTAGSTDREAVLRLPFSQYVSQMRNVEQVSQHDRAVAAALRHAMFERIDRSTLVTTPTTMAQEQVMSKNFQTDGTRVFYYSSCDFVSCPQHAFRE